MEKETWKAVVGYNGDYQVSNLGRVKSLKKKGGIKELILKQRKTTPSAPVRYWRVDLYKDGTQKSHLVSHLVLEAFVSPRPEGMEACHGEKGPLVNSLDNIYWGTHEQNMKDKVRDGTDNRGENHPLTTLKEEDVIAIKKILSEGNMGREEIAKIYNVLPHVITSIKTGNTWGWLEVDGFTPNGDYSSKITKSNAIAIKKMLAEGNLKQREIAEIFNINECTVSKINRCVAYNTYNKFFEDDITST